MKRNILFVLIILSHISFVWDTKANDSINLSCYLTSATSAKEVSSNSDNFKGKKWLFGKRKQVKQSKSLNLASNPHLQIGEPLFSNEQISISSVYPNPATTHASINYVLSENASNAKIILYNVLGNVVGEYPLTKDVRKLNISTSELSSGVYFYTLSVNGKNLVTHRLIIKHQS